MNDRQAAQELVTAAKELTAGLSKREATSMLKELNAEVAKVWNHMDTVGKKAQWLYRKYEASIVDTDPLHQLMIGIEGQKHDWSGMQRKFFRKNVQFDQGVFDAR